MKKQGILMKFRRSKSIGKLLVVLSGIHGSKWSITTYFNSVAETQTMYKNRVEATKAYLLWK